MASMAAWRRYALGSFPASWANSSKAVEDRGEHVLTNSPPILIRGSIHPSRNSNVLRVSFIAYLRLVKLGDGRTV